MDFTVFHGKFPNKGFHGHGSRLGPTWPRERGTNSTVRVWCSNETVCPPVEDSHRPVQASQPLGLARQPDHRTGPPAKPRSHPQCDRAKAPVRILPCRLWPVPPATGSKGIPAQSPSRCLRDLAESPT